MQEIKVTVNHEAGLHARPLASFVKKANEFESNILVTNLSKETSPANGKSLLKLLLLAVTCGQEILIQAEGVDAKVALETLQNLIVDNFE